jgi:hypothetical protein
MKTLLIQEAGRHKVNSNFRECLSLQRAMQDQNHDAEVWGLGHDNYTKTPDWDSYDLIINLENHDETNWIPDLSKAKTKKFIWSIDAHCKGIQSYMKTFYDGKYDLILQSTPEFLNEHSVWFPNCYDDDLIMPLGIEKRHDVGFCGMINNRGGLIDILSSFFAFRLDEKVLGQNMVHSINSYKVHFNANISIDINYRNFETIGCGTCLLTNYNQYYDKLGFIDGVNCLIYKDVNEMIEKIKMALNNDNLRYNIEQGGLELAKQHTYKKRIKIIEELL